MRLTPEARDAVNAAITEAHADGRPSREIAARVVTALHDMEPSGMAWVSTYVDDLAIIGAMKVCADWRRRHQHPARTKSGPADLPAFVGAVREGSAVQLRMSGLDLESLRTHKRRLAGQRNTLSVEIAAIDGLIKLMEADAKLETVGDALAVLMVGAA